MLNPVTTPVWSEMFGSEVPRTARLTPSTATPAAAKPPITRSRLAEGRDAITRNGRSRTAVNLTATAAASATPAALSRRCRTNMIAAVDGRSIRKSLWKPPSAKKR